MKMFHDFFILIDAHINAIVIVLSLLLSTIIILRLEGNWHLVIIVMSMFELSLIVGWMLWRFFHF